MEILMIVVVGVLLSVSTYLILSKRLLRVILGTMLISHGAHLLILTMGGLKADLPPLLTESGGKFTDPLPHALILTAIVIGFGVTAFVLVLSYRTYKEHQTDNLEQLRGSADE